MIKVELDIFSGRPNPTWILSRREENELLDQLQADPSLMQPETSVSSILGYRGYILHPQKDRYMKRHRMELPPRFRIGGTSKHDQSAALWLLDSSAKTDSASDDAKDVAKDAIIQPAPPPSPEHIEQRAAGRALERDEGANTVEQGVSIMAASDYIICADTLFHSSSPDYFAFWNDPSYVRKNNCYNFAANNRNNTYARPGRQGEYNWPSPADCSKVHQGLLADGFWTDVGCYIPDECCTTVIVALVIWPGVDFHFYRLIENWDGVERWWAHKIAKLPASYKDDWDQIITDPKFAARGPYTEFCGFYYGDAHFTNSSLLWQRWIVAVR